MAFEAFPKDLSAKGMDVTERFKGWRNIKENDCSDKSPSGIPR